MGDDLTPSFDGPSTLPPVPPPVPPRVPAPEAPSPLPPADPPAATIRIDARRSRQAPTRSDGGTGVVVSLLLMTAAGTLAYVAWPTLARQLAPSRAAVPRQRGAPPDSPTPPALEAPPATRPTPPSAATADPKLATDRGSGDGDRPRHVVPVDDAAPTAPHPSPAASGPVTTAARSVPPVAAAAAPDDPGSARAIVDAAIRAAALALRSGDLAAAGDRLAAAETAAGDDAEAVERAAAWRRLLRYAEGFSPLRDRALAASVGNEYTVDGKLISVVEVNDRLFIYRRLGRNVRIARDQIPRAIVVDIVTHWFRGANRPANELFLGAYHVCREPPNVERARAAWDRARRGGEADADLLLRLLDDPALVAPAP